MLRWRLLLGTLLIAILLASGWLEVHSTTAGVWLLPVAVLAVVLGTQETVQLARRHGLSPSLTAAYLGNLCILLGNWLPVWLPPGQGSPTLLALAALGWPLLALVVAGMLAFVLEMARYREPGRALGNLAATLFVLVYVGVLLGFAVQLRIQWGIEALASLLVVVKMGDIGAYTVGRLIGRHKMSPRISPGKTLEGAAGALAFAALGAWGVCALLGGPASASAASWKVAAGWIAFGVTIALVGLLGDLAESMLKRSAGVKDSSTWLPGFGGALDLLDSILFAAPVAWLFWFAGIVGG